MARVTVEDCIDKIPNRYELLMVATQRAKDISSGAPIMVSRDNDKNPVIALREIAEEKVNIEDLQKSLVMGLQKYVEVEEPEEEEMEIQAAEKELAELAEYIVEGKDIRSNPDIEKHADWVDSFLPVYKEKGIEITKDNAEDILKEEVGQVFAKVLEDAGVYKCTPEGREAFMRFINKL